MIKAAPGVSPPALEPGERPAKKPIWTHLYAQVLAAIVLGALMGHFWPTLGEGLKPLGDLCEVVARNGVAPGDVVDRQLPVGRGERHQGAQGIIAVKAELH